MTPNKPDAPTAAIVIWFYSGHYRRGVGDPERWADRRHHVHFDTLVSPELPEHHLPYDAERFSFGVENVFYIKTIDRVIVTGTVSSGTVKPGDRLTVRSGGTAIAVTVEHLEHPQLKLESASKGQPVGLVLLGIRKHQVTAGDVVETP